MSGDFILSLPLGQRTSTGTTYTSCITLSFCLQTLTAILKDHVEHDLTPQDRQALAKASRRFVLGISLGALLGGGLAASLPFKGRYALSNLRHLPPLYPQGRPGPLDRQLAAEHLRFALRTLLFFAGGAVAGSQLGGLVGLRSAQGVVRSEGSADRINLAIQRTRDDLRRRQSSLGSVQPSSGPRASSSRGLEEAQDGENTALAEQWQREQPQEGSSSSSFDSSTEDFQHPNAPPRSVGELLIASQQPAAQQDFQVYADMMARISSVGSLAMSAGWFAGLGLSLVGPFGLRWIQKRHGSFMFRAGMSQAERTGLLKSQLAWAAKLSILSLVGLQLGANLGGPRALDKAWSEAMEQLSARPDSDEVKSRLQAALRQARSHPVIPLQARQQPQSSAPEGSGASASSNDRNNAAQPKSRWEELRNTGKPESAWARIRQQQHQTPAQSESSSSSNGDTSQADKRADAHKAFQRMLEDERQGRDTEFR